jgi:hypothetical protein
LIYIIPQEELSASAAEHEAAPEDPIKRRRKKRSLKPPVHLYQFFHDSFPNLFISP